MFDIVKQEGSDRDIIKVYHTLQSQEMGEYFGYALVAEDFDNDGFDDLAIAAPFHKKNRDSYDNGAVYIFKNSEGKSFDLHTILESSYDLNGCFGLTISKIGDIDMDGYNGNLNAFFFHT